MRDLKLSKYSPQPHYKHSNSSSKGYLLEFGNTPDPFEPGNEHGAHVIVDGPRAEEVTALIAATPELLDALSNMLDLHGPRGEGRVWTDEDGDNWYAAKRLLAAIQGGDDE